MDEFDYVCFGRVFKIKDAPDSKLQVLHPLTKGIASRADLAGLCFLWRFDHAADRRSRSSGEVSDGSECLYPNACLQTWRQSEDAFA